MNILENIRGALGAIRSNALRSLLTMLGVIIGVASVVLMVAIGQGAQRGVASRIQSLGTNLLTILPGSTGQTNVRQGGESANTSLKNADLLVIQDIVPGIQGIAPELRQRMQITMGSTNISTTVAGTLSEYPSVRNAKIAYGTFFTTDHVQHREKVAVVGQEVVRTLFLGEEIPLGHEIRINAVMYTIIGILERRGQQGFINLDDIVLIPLTTMQSRITGNDVVGTISVSVRDVKTMSQTQQILAAVLRNERKITDPANDDFTVLNQADAVETLNEVTGIFTLLLGGIAAISLLVGGIGVMNIMLVSVTERTREIGIRKAIGAKRSDILFQFLVESTVLSMLGGTAGILVSLIGSWIVRSLFPIDATVSLGSVIVAFLFSAGVGIFFGMLPAYKAATLRPIQALRYE